MKTIISIGIALIAGWAVIGHGAASAQGNTDGFAFNPYTMSKKPFIQDRMTGGANVLVKLPERITPEDRIPRYPNSSISQPNNGPNLDAIPKYPTATWVIRQHKPY